MICIPRIKQLLKSISYQPQLVSSLFTHRRDTATAQGHSFPFASLKRIDRCDLHFFQGTRASAIEAKNLCFVPVVISWYIDICNI